MVFETYQRAVRIATSDGVFPTDKPLLIAFCFRHIGLPFTSAQVLAEHIIEIHHRGEDVTVLSQTREA
jgi:hypothetical protein